VRQRGRGPVSDVVEAGACFLNYRIRCCTARREVEAQHRDFSPAPDFSDMRGSLCDQSVQHRKAGRVLLRSFAAMCRTVRARLCHAGSRQFAPVRNGCSPLADGHEGPVPHLLNHEMSEHVHSQIWSVSPTAGHVQWSCW
jgi:hypothetical protein